MRANFHIKYLCIWLLVWQLNRVDFQPLEDKMSGKLVTWDGKNINIVARGVLIKSVLTSQAIFHLIPLTIPPGCFESMKKNERFFRRALEKSPVVSARSIGRRYVGQSVLADWGSSTLKNSHGI
jgi:hypothetical protein